MLIKLNFRSLAAVFICVSIFSLTSCKKNLTADELTVISEDDAEAEVVYNDVYEDVLGSDSSISIAGNDLGAPGMEPIMGTPPPPCYTITYDTAAFPKKIMIDFGTVGCVGRDGKTRKGKIKISFSDYLRNYNASATTTFDGYSVKGPDADDVEIAVGGTVVITNKTTTPGTRIFNRQVIDGSLTKPNGNYIHWSNDYTFTRVAGQGTPFWFWDDAWTITGNGGGTAKRDNNTYTWTRQILTDLHKSFACRWFDQGTVQLTINGKTLVTDFGNGTCDRFATVEYNGKTHTIRMR